MSDKLRPKGPAEVHQPGLARMLVAAVNQREMEFARVSGVLHDQVSQVLSAIGLQLDVLRLDFKQQAPEIEERTEEIQEMLERVINQLRDLSFELNPSVVERAGLQAALDRLAGRIRANFSGTFRIHFDPAERIPVPIASAFYKIAERALEGCPSRPGCNQIEVQVKLAQANYVLEIHDNSDFSKLAGEERSFLEMMLAHYASQSGIELKIRTIPGKGIVIRASHPVSAQGADHPR
jgi:signal transduction histidine kinase